MFNADGSKLLARIFNAKDMAAIVLQSELRSPISSYNMPSLSHTYSTSIEQVTPKSNDVALNTDFQQEFAHLYTYRDFNQTVNRSIISFTAPNAAADKTLFHFNNSFRINRSFSDANSCRISYVLQYISEDHNGLGSVSLENNALVRLVELNEIHFEPDSLVEENGVTSYNRLHGANKVWARLEKNQKIDLLRLIYTNKIEGMLIAKSVIVAKTLALSKLTEQIKKDKMELKSFFTFRKATKEMLQNRIRENENKIIQLAETDERSAVRRHNIDGLTDEQRTNLAEDAKNGISSCLNAAFGTFVTNLISNPGVNFSDLLEHEEDAEVIGYFKALDYSLLSTIDHCKAVLIDDKSFSEKSKKVRGIAGGFSEEVAQATENGAIENFNKASKQRAPLLASGLYPSNPQVRASVSRSLKRKVAQISQGVQEPITRILDGNQGHVIDTQALMTVQLVG
jgi:hypothetical protein